jgi:TPR repeat protein
MRLLLAIVLALGAGVGHADERLKPALDAYARGQFDSARTAFERLSKQGVAAADYNLAVMHLRGERRDASVQEAVRLMTRAAQGGFVTAMVGLGELYERGHGELPADLPLSVQWYRRGAEAGSVEAQLAVATAHYLGRGAALDRSQAARWYRLAAQAGDGGAMYLYASMCESGDGIERDLAEARYWYAAAARSGEVGAAEKARALEPQLHKTPGS